MTPTLLPCPALIVKNSDLFTYRECATPSKKNSADVVDDMISIFSAIMRAAYCIVE